jgi:hypothetical protein
MNAGVKLRGFFRWFTSARVTVVLLATLSLFLFLNVAIPQQAVLGDEPFEDLVGRSSAARFLLVTLGLGNMATSPVFITVLGLFFFNLGSVLIARVGPTWRKVAMRPRKTEGLQAWARMEETFAGTPGPGWSTANLTRTLRGFGYPVKKVGERTFWGVKHRSAPLGFLLFHLSFFLFFAGGVLIFYTRFVGTAVLSEGQAFTGGYSEVHRQATVQVGRPLAFVVDEVETQLKDGEPVHLSARFTFQQAGPPVTLTSQVNRPAEWGPTIILVERAGLAPRLWLQDVNGYTLDRIVVPTRTRSSEPTTVSLADDQFQVLIHPLEQGQPFPSRDQLSSTSLRIQVLSEGTLRFNGELAPGQAADLGIGRLVVEEMRQWVGVRVVSERGGGLLIAGFLAAVLGLIWRLLWYRREVVVDWDDARFHLVGRSEYFSERFQNELQAIHSLLTETDATAGTDGPAGSASE